MGNSALLTVLRQEIDRFNGLLGVIHTSLNLLTLAVRGEIVMSEALEDAYDALLSQRIPLEWRVYTFLIVKLTDSLFLEEKCQLSL